MESYELLITFQHYLAYKIESQYFIFQNGNVDIAMIHLSATKKLFTEIFVEPVLNGLKAVYATDLYCYF